MSSEPLPVPNVGPDLHPALPCSLLLPIELCRARASSPCQDAVKNMFSRCHLFLLIVVLELPNP